MNCEDGHFLDTFFGDKRIMQFSKIAIRGCALGLVAASMLLAGCSSVPLDESAKAGTTQDDAAAKHRSASGAALDSNAVYFDFDSYTVKPEFMPVVETHARNVASRDGGRQHRQPRKP